MQKIHFVDIETTHLDHTQGEIIEVAILTSTDGGRTISNRLVTKVKPLHLERAQPKALDINGYSEERWQGAPKWSQVAPVIYAQLRTGIIVAHNISFDWVWLSYHIEKETGKNISWYKMCTQGMALEHLPLPKPSMRCIRGFFGWSEDKAHTALKDANDCHLLWSKVHRSTIIQRIWWRLKFRWS